MTRYFLHNTFALIGLSTCSYNYLDTVCVLRPTLILLSKVCNLINNLISKQEVLYVQNSTDRKQTPQNNYLRVRGQCVLVRLESQITPHL